MPHPDEGLIHAWLDGELDATEAARVEALVASDPEWSAAAADARGLIAASARIVGSLDRVPANVAPKPEVARPRAARSWMLRAAAVLVLIGGSAVVLNQPNIDTVAVTIPVKESPAAAVPPAAAPAGPARDSKSTVQNQALDLAKQKDVAGLVTAERRADAAPAAAPAPAAIGAAARAKSLVLNMTEVTRAPRCFSQRAPADSVSRIIRLDSAELADSIRLERLRMRGDTLAAVNGELIAVPVRCPAP